MHSLLLSPYIYFFHDFIDSVNDAKRKDIKHNEYWNVVCNIHTPKKTFLIKFGGQI